MPETVILVLIGLIAGTMSGMFGIGGGAIMVPLMVIFLGYTQTMGNGTSLAALLLPVGIFACIAYYRAGKLNIRVAGSMAAGLAMGTWFGANIALNLDATVLRLSYAVFLLYLSWRNIAPRQWWAERQSKTMVVVAEETALDLNNPRIWLTCVVIGIFAGVLSGLFGIGGGVIIVTILTALLHFDQKLANGTSLGAMLLPVGLPAVVAYNEAGDVNIGAAAILALMIVIASLLGARLALGLPAKTVRRAYGIFLLFVGLRFLLFG